MYVTLLECIIYAFINTCLAINLDRIKFISFYKRLILHVALNSLLDKHIMGGFNLIIGCVLLEFSVRVTFNCRPFVC